jgi:hypothetical protein
MRVPPVSYLNTLRSSLLSESMDMGESARDEAIIVCQQQGEFTGRFSQ